VQRERGGDERGDALQSGEPPDEGEEHHGARGVQSDVPEVVAGRVEAVQRHVEDVREPRERMPVPGVAHVERPRRSRAP
jgi:hypothetical protein